MLRAVFILLLLACGTVRAGEAVDLRKISALHSTIAAPAPGRVVVNLENPTAEPWNVRIERGTVFTGAKDRGKLIALRTTEAAVTAKGSIEMSIPAATLSSTALDRTQAFSLSEEKVTGLDPVLDFFQTQNDVPVITAQLIVLCVQEDIAFAKWKDFLTRQGAPDKTGPDETVAAIDALGVLRQVHPQRTFALASDPELKLRALRHPVARGKAMQLYGISLPEAPLPPDLGTLLHTKPGDNCPICRQRALMQPREDGL